MRKLLAVAVLIIPLAGCYKATIHTGLAPAPNQVVEREWAHSWLYGLVPPSDLDVGSQCPNGVARVETEHSFLNQLAAGLTWGIYTPISIRAICAQ